MFVSASFSNVSIRSRITYKSVPDPTLIWYKCNDGDLGTNTIYNYATGTTHTTVGNPSLDNTTYKTGTASLYLTGTQYIIPPVINFGNYAGNTYSVWFKLLSLDHGACFAIFSGNDTQALATALLMWAPNNSNDIRDYTYTNGYQMIAPTKNLMDNTWHHFAWVFGNTSTHKLYIDGILKGSVTTTPFNLNANGTGTFLFHVPWGDSSWQPIGNVDDIRLYNQELTSDQIWSLYTKTK